MGDVGYRSRVRMEIVRGPLRRITVPAGDEPRLESDADRQKVQRACEHHMPRCPICRSTSAAIDITELQLFE